MFVQYLRSLFSVQHHVNAGGYGPGAFRNSRPFERNPTTWVPPAPTRNGSYLHKSILLYWNRISILIK